MSDSTTPRAFGPIMAYLLDQGDVEGLKVCLRVYKEEGFDFSLSELYLDERLAAVDLVRQASYEWRGQILWENIYYGDRAFAAAEPWEAGR